MDSKTKRTGKRRLTFEIDENLHSKLKAEAAQKGVSLGSHCAAILAGEETPSPAIEDFDATTLSIIPLNELRDTCNRLTKDKPRDWQRQVRMINTEMRRRFRT